ncbi:MAG: rutR [Rhizobacter sp.]|nr:rutR [Rhizobacter sp.]
MYSTYQLQEFQVDRKTADLEIDGKQGDKPASNAKIPPRLRRIGVPVSTASKPVSRRQKALDDKRGVILSAAQSLFSRFGLHGTSIDQIADKADVSKSNLLYYFVNKEDLYRTVLRNLLAVWLEPLNSFDADKDPENALRDYIRYKLAFSRDQAEASRLFCLEVVGGAPLIKNELQVGLREMLDRKSKVIQAWIDRGLLNPVEPHHFLFSVWAITQHYADFAAQVEAVTGRSLKDKAFFEQTVVNVQQIILRGVLPHSVV